jgi:hypothetical protein
MLLMRNGKKRFNSLHILTPIDGEMDETGDQQNGWPLRSKSDATENNNVHFVGR